MNRTWNQDKTLLESADATHIQFAFDKTWRLLSSVYLSDPNFKGELLIDDPENTAAITYCVSYPLEPGSSTSLVIYNAFDGLYSDEHAWLVVRPSESPNGPATMLQSFTQLKLTNLDGKQDINGSRSNLFMRLVKMSDEEDLAMQLLLISEPQSGSPSNLDVMEL
ncbi:hypothetical protein GN244_ATG06558 [Phytophthora infestans]|uniref:Uncharacterized protein n=1 Tax=Phytophthora infestans TaxID=4787 RepID=A0A833WXE1_PHYIN|nr:hypothetical protein GN244_ATG06558 [Phytophthora infestans]